MSTEITVSERAARRIGQILKGEGDGAMLRISVEGGGCSGFQYKFDVEHNKAEDDLVIANDGAVVLVDPASVPFLAGSELDFVDDLIGASFRVVNPNADGVLRLRHQLFDLSQFSACRRTALLRCRWRSAPRPLAAIAPARRGSRP